MAMFVIDASAALPWCFSDEATDAARALLARFQGGDEAVVPPHWPFEVANALLVAVRRGRIPLVDVQEFLVELASLPVRVDAVVGALVPAGVFSLAERYQLTIYDAAYLELAIRENVPLATRDVDLQKASRAEGIALLEA